jgi:DNA replication and repair protein RecF
LTGPHRDDLTLLIDERPARLFASEGQKKTLIAALRFAEWERLAKRLNTSPLMAIDDLGLHLDQVRSEILINSLKKLGQTFITTPHLELNEANALHIQDGSIMSK